MTSTDTLIEAVEILLFNNQNGIFNVSNMEPISICDAGNLVRNTIATISPIEEIRKDSGIHLVNCVMDISKLLKFYVPRNVSIEILGCWRRMKNK